LDLLDPGVTEQYAELNAKAELEKRLHVMAGRQVT
jgi:hypothetical protein